jgi:hypothetical protein
MEVSRVARPKTIFAAWTYSLLRISKQIDALVDDHHFNTLGKYWDGNENMLATNTGTPLFPLKNSGASFNYRI